MPSLGPIIVRVGDGSLFSCTVEYVDELGENRWIFEATNGTRHIGPSPPLRQTPVAIQLMVERWYEEHRDFG